jgi:hypothetical protein
MTISVAGDAQGLVLYQFIPAGRTEHEDMSVEFLRRLRDVVKRKRPEKYNSMTGKDIENSGQGIWLLEKMIWNFLEDTSGKYETVSEQKR